MTSLKHRKISETRYSFNCLNLNWKSQFPGIMGNSKFFERYNSAREKPKKVISLESAIGEPLNNFEIDGSKIIAEILLNGISNSSTSYESREKDNYYHGFQNRKDKWGIWVGTKKSNVKLIGNGNLCYVPPKLMGEIRWIEGLDLEYGSSNSLNVLGRGA